MRNACCVSPPLPLPAGEGNAHAGIRQTGSREPCFQHEARGPISLGPSSSPEHGGGGSYRRRASAKPGDHLLPSSSGRVRVHAEHGFAITRIAIPGTQQSCRRRASHDTRRRHLRHRTFGTLCAGSPSRRHGVAMLRMDGYRLRRSRMTKGGCVFRSA